jgi:hypothetical protein
LRCRSWTASVKVRTAPHDALIADITPPEFRGRAFGFTKAIQYLKSSLLPQKLKNPYSNNVK